MNKITVFFLFLFFVLLPNLIIASQILFDNFKKIHVIAGDIGNKAIGMKSTLTKIDCNGNLIYIGTSDDRGFIETYLKCEYGDQLKADPEDPHYFHAFVNCTKDSIQRIELSRKRIINNLESNAEYYDKVGDYAKSTLIYSELHKRYKAIDAADASYMEKKVYSSWGKYFDTDESMVYDPYQEKYVMSPSLKNSTKQFQMRNNINVTGKLDYPTLSEAANAPIGTFMFEKHKIK